MTGRLFIFWNRWFPSFGALGFASFLIAVVSGIPLAISYQVDHAFDSLQLLQLTNPGARYFRSLHYWSGQLFILTTFIHVIEHLIGQNEKKLKPGVWLRLVLALLFALFVMLSGFILKADAEGRMAGQILGGLLSTIPLTGDGLKLMVLGSSGDLDLVYVHHLVTTTLFLWVVIIEHTRRIWPDLLSTVYSLGICTVLAVLIVPALELPDAPLIRGPWYFIGLQEILHWIQQPLVVIGILLIVLILFILVRWLTAGKASLVKRFLVFLLFMYMALTINNWVFRDGNWKQRVPGLASDFNEEMENGDN